MQMFEYRQQTFQLCSIKIRSFDGLANDKMPTAILKYLQK